MPPGLDPLPATTFMRMSDPSADTVIVQDVLHEEPGSAWRWTNQHPRFKMWVDVTEGWSLFVKFTLAGVILKETGPIAIRFTVNDAVLDTVTFGKEQQYTYTKKIPDAMLKRNAPNIVGLDLDRVYVSQRDGVKLGILIQEIGFQRAEAR